MREDERRTAARTATRLRPAKLLGEGDAFLGDCAILDRSAAGARVGLFGAPDLPAEMSLFDETERERRKVGLVWQEKERAGLRFDGDAEEVEPRDAARLSGRYYALD